MANDGAQAQQKQQRLLRVFSGDKTLANEIEQAEIDRFHQSAEQTFQSTNPFDLVNYETTMRDSYQQMQVTQEEASLFARRYVPGQVTLDKAPMTAMRTSLGGLEDVRDVPARELEGKSSWEQKKTKEKAAKQKKDAFTTAKENVNTAFAADAVVMNEWSKKNLMSQTVSVPNEKDATQQQLFDRALKGDCSILEQLDPVLRNVAARKYLEGMKGYNARTPKELVNAIYRAQGVSGLMNPLFRIGLSVLMHGGTVGEGVMRGFTAQECQEIEDLCNQRIMSATMYAIPKTEDLPENMTPEEKTSALIKNRQAQVFMMKTLFMAHLGGMQKSVNGQKAAWDKGMATAFAHCSRVTFSLPTEASGSPYKADTLGFYKRTAATHALKRKGKGQGAPDLREQKMKLGWLFGQYGMNVGVGGLGNPGVPGRRGDLRKIRSDGSGGHIYMHVDEGDSTHYTGLLIGFESDAPGVLNQTGHKHGAGNPEFMSSFGGLRIDEIGDKYGGRSVDCSGLDATIFQSLMATFSARIQSLQSTAADPDSPMQESAQAQLINICDLLSGRQMDEKDIMMVCGLTTNELIRGLRHQQPDQPQQPVTN